MIFPAWPWGGTVGIVPRWCSIGVVAAWSVIGWSLTDLLSFLTASSQGVRSASASAGRRYVHSVRSCSPIACPPEPLQGSQQFRLNLAAESSKVLKRLDAWKEEVGPTLYGRESGQALYLSSDWSLRNCKVKRAILGTDHRIVLIAKFVGNSGRLPKRSAQTRIGG